MDEAMKCDRVALIQEGRILSVNSPQKIRAGFTRKLFSARATEKYKLINALRQFPSTVTAYPFGDSVHVTFTDNRVDETLDNYLAKVGITDVTITENEASIEDRFLELMEK
jgi:ABC-2 type transport system ATP-binding protein